MDEANLESAILEHLHTVAHSKRALLQVAVEIAKDYPVQASTLVSIIRALTRSADMLLGDTAVGGP